MNIRRTERGFTLLEGIIVMVVIAIIGLVVVLIVYNLNSKNDNANKNNNNSQQQGKDDTGKTDDSNLLKTYISTVGGFTMSYPEAWKVIGTVNGQASDVLSGNETQLHFQVAPNTTTIDNYAADLYIRDAKPQDATWPLYPNGSIVETFANNISAWEDNQTQTLARGTVKNMCPTIRVASDDGFGFKLKNGKYIEFIGGFCMISGNTTTYSYQQQRSSTEFDQTMQMLQSIKQK